MMPACACERRTLVDMPRLFISNRRSARGLKKVPCCAERECILRHERGAPPRLRNIEARGIKRGGDSLLKEGDRAAGIIVRNCMRISVSFGLVVQVCVCSGRNRQKPEHPYQADEHPHECPLLGAEGVWFAADRKHGRQVIADASRGGTGGKPN
jgi:hypothetical protein